MGTHWDDIYRDFEKGGDAWATLSEDIHPAFIDFLEHTHFPHKHALDIGCGNGKYLMFLRAHGFAVDGIDSSETAVRMSGEAVPEANVQVADMFTWDYPANRYDLILSVSTLQHGFKPQIASAISKIHQALKDGGHIFITLPDWSKTQDWLTFKYHDILGDGTFAPLEGPEKGLPHSFYKEEEIPELFKDFHDIETHLDEIGRRIITGKK